jgi:hypothetical protein
VWGWSSRGRAGRLAGRELDKEHLTALQRLEHRDTAMISSFFNEFVPDCVLWLPVACAGAGWGQVRDLVDMMADGMEKPNKFVTVNTLRVSCHTRSQDFISNALQLFFTHCRIYAVLCAGSRSQELVGIETDEECEVAMPAALT